MSKKGDLQWRAVSDAKVLTSFNGVSVITERNQDRVSSVACCTGCIWELGSLTLNLFAVLHTQGPAPVSQMMTDVLSRIFWSRQGQEKWVTIRLFLLITQVFLFGSHLHVTFWSEEKDELLHVLIVAFILSLPSPPPLQTLMPTAPLQVPPQLSPPATATNLMRALTQRWVLGPAEHRFFPF